MNKQTILGLGLLAGSLSLVAFSSTSGCSPVTRKFGPGGTAGGGGGEACKQGDTQDCYDGPMGTENKGECHGGKQMCGADGKFGGTCIGEVTPVTPNPTLCSQHMDQNCDGVPDRCPLDFIWGAAYGVANGAGVSPPSMGIGPDGSIAIAGYTTGQLDFGTGTIASASGDADVFVAKLDASGKALWSQKWGDTTDQQCFGAAVDAQGNIYLAGSYNGSLDGLTIGIPPSNGSSDVWVVKLDPNGAPIWGRAGGDTWDPLESTCRHASLSIL